MPKFNLDHTEILTDVIKTWEIFDERLCMFLAQVGHESSDLTRLTESLNYAATALRSIFGKHRISDDEIAKYGRTSTQPANQEMLANTLYGGDWGLKNLGNSQPGDGWEYRGRGAIQLTGRSNYQKCGDAIGVDLINNPHLLSDDIEVTLRAAAWFFQTYTTGIDINVVTRQINGGTVGLDDRKQRYTKSLNLYNELIKKHLVT